NTTRGYEATAIHTSQRTSLHHRGQSSVTERFLSWQLPIIGKKSAKSQVQSLMLLMALCAVAVIAVFIYSTRLANNNALQIDIVGEMLMHTQRLAKAAPYALEGSPPAFEQLRDSRDQIDADLEGLIKGDPQRGLSASSSTVQGKLSTLADRWAGTRTAASTIASEEAALLAFNAMVSKMNNLSPRLLQLTEEISALKLQSNARGREVAAAGQLVMLTQRLGKNANALVSGTGANAEVALTLSRDMDLFKELADALLSGNDGLRIAAASDKETQTRLEELSKLYMGFRNEVAGSLNSLQAVVQAKDAERAILRDSEQLRSEVSALKNAYRDEQSKQAIYLSVMGLLGLMVLGSAVMAAKVLLEDSRQRALEAESQRIEAERLEDDAKRTNERNQAAIL
ncbi:MAG TPA: type IV pili methyl-accepting chemotaxis transducer N-terminal domain-containing protein, partial [Burkholderiaceae bacterium]|nr:type IV pili methyl-accepting chemotaxis transducer N-terminal domain-containing protein [Burkholderiaceae bacterium]